MHSLAPKGAWPSGRGLNPWPPVHPLSCFVFYYFFPILLFFNLFIFHFIWFFYHLFKLWSNIFQHKLSLFFPLIFYYTLFHFIWTFFGWLFIPGTLMANEIYLVMIMDLLELIKPSIFQFYQWMINRSFLILWGINKCLYINQTWIIWHIDEVFSCILTYSFIWLIVTSFDLLCFHFLLTL